MTVKAYSTYAGDKLLESMYITRRAQRANRRRLLRCATLTSTRLVPNARARFIPRCQAMRSWHASLR